MIDREALQLQLEQESLELGVKRYHDLLEERGLPDSAPGRRLLRAWLLDMALLLEERKKAANAGLAGRWINVANLLLGQDTMQIALLALRGAIDAAYNRRRATDAANHIAGLVIEHVEWQSLDPELRVVMEKQLSKSQSERHRRAVARYTVREHGKPAFELLKKRVALGSSLLGFVEQATGRGVFLNEERKTIRKRTTSTVRVEFDPEVAKLLTKWESRCAVLDPLTMPMVVPPTPWTSLHSGGFRTLKIGGLVKTFRTEEYAKRAAGRDYSKVYAAVNAVQETPWEINRAVFDVMQKAWAESLSVGGLPDQDPEPLPAKPVDIATNKVARTEWKRIAAKVHEENNRRVSQRGCAMQQLRLAEKFVDKAPLYFVHTVDWRGRLYPVATNLHPQANDTGRALLRFHKGKALGERGAFWLAVHIANLFGVDKVSFAERLKWVNDNEAKLFDSALNPLDGERFWTTADSPWQALAACFEWMGYSVQGESYVSHLPIALDGSCNGLQNFSAMLRDPAGAKATNLLPSDKPNDIYQQVADVVKAKLGEVPYEDEGFAAAKWWLALGVSRSLVKRAVMTKPYGVTRSGMRDQLLDYLRKEGHMKQAEYGEMFKRCFYIADIINVAIDEVVVAAGMAMGWLKEAAKVVAGAEQFVQWTTPNGFLAVQMYSKPSTIAETDVIVGGKRICLELYDYEGGVVDRRRQVMGVSPNFVHSCDAAHLMATVLRCQATGVESFAMIHDSYGTLAADTEVLAAALREAFVEQYSADVLGKLRAELSAALPEGTALPELPSFGSLDLAAVKDSGYFFA